MGGVEEGRGVGKERGVGERSGGSGGEEGGEWEEWEMEGEGSVGREKKGGGGVYN